MVFKASLGNETNKRLSEIQVESLLVSYTSRLHNMTVLLHLFPTIKEFKANFIRDLAGLVIF